MYKYKLSSTAPKRKKKKKRIDVTTHSRAQIQGLLDRIVGITTQRGSHLFNDAIWANHPTTSTCNKSRRIIDANNHSKGKEKLMKHLKSPVKEQPRTGYTIYNISAPFPWNKKTNNNALC